jgi:hypothetical protein
MWLGSQWPGVAAIKTYESAAGKDVNKETEESTALGVITKQRPVKTQQTEKT